MFSALWTQTKIWAQKTSSPRLQPNISFFPQQIHNQSPDPNLQRINLCVDSQSGGVSAQNNPWQTFLISSRISHFADLGLISDATTDRDRSRTLEQEKTIMEENWEKLKVMNALLGYSECRQQGKSIMVKQRSYFSVFQTNRCAGKLQVSNR